jgi:hypothetical protein
MRNQLAVPNTQHNSGKSEQGHTLATTPTTPTHTHLVKLWVLLSLCHHLRVSHARQDGHVYAAKSTAHPTLTERLQHQHQQQQQQQQQQQHTSRV